MNGKNKHQALMALHYEKQISGELPVYLYGWRKSSGLKRNRFKEAKDALVREGVVSIDDNGKCSVI